jgi:hypothetical protein
MRRSAHFDLLPIPASRNSLKKRAAAENEIARQPPPPFFNQVGALTKV